MNRKVSFNITNTNTYEKLTTDNGKRINSIPKMAINSQAKHKFKNKWKQKIKAGERLCGQIKTITLTHLMKQFRHKKSLKVLHSNSFTSVGWVDA